jgi:predicted nucleotide-binding protein (sugar kinase/HSP70/actin superfamily)
MAPIVSFSNKEIGKILEIFGSSGVNSRLILLIYWLKFAKIFDAEKVIRKKKKKTLLPPL